MFFLTPKYLKQGKLYLKEARKRVNYHRDRWSAETLQAFEAKIEELRVAMKARSRQGVAAAENALEKLCAQHCPSGPGATIGENTEVIVVAIIVALGIRTYFLQPFTIPTASMQPTLFGITGRIVPEGPPNVLKRVWDFAWCGRTWHNAVAKADEQITEIVETKWAVLFTYTRITTDQGNVYWVNESLKPLRDHFGLGARFVKKGEPIVQGFTDRGDYVFVDKFSYHFRKPKRGEVFVFDTRGIPTNDKFLDAARSIPRPGALTQYYIKRLAGMPGDELAISAPTLYINGQTAPEATLQRVMQGTFRAPVNGYRGYSNTVGDILRSPAVPHTVEPRSYFALGDNSYESSDSRDWGHVREDNLTGVGVFVYWPFSRAAGGRWGFIR